MAGIARQLGAEGTHHGRGNRERDSAVEDYVKAIYALEGHGKGEAVSTSALAQRLSVTPGSASAMVKKLAQRGLVTHVRYHGVSLTAKGRKVALEVLRHHRLIELYLTEELGMPWDRVHDEAEVLEHVLSEELEQLIARKLGHPTYDPHGDPIPSAELDIHEAKTERLSALAAGTTGTFVRVSDADPSMLRYLAEQGIATGERLEVIERQPFGGPILARMAGQVHALGGRLAEAMRVEVG